MALRSFWVTVCLLFGQWVYANDERTVVDDFESGSLDSWERRSFNGETKYQPSLVDGRRVLRAEANNSASGIAIETRIDLFKTPYLNWQWKVEAPLSAREETEKQGDDYAARVYVVIDGGIRFWKTTAVNYVWSSLPDTNSWWPNAYAPNNAMMIALRGSSSSTNWYFEKRNVYQDLIQAFGDKGSDRANEKAYRYIDAVAIMTDTDDGGGKAIAYYDDIHFTAK